MDLRKLLYLIEVVERGSIGKAAAALDVTQPALTKSLRLLETEIEAKLVERSPSGVVPTEFGRSLYARAKAITAELDRARNEIAQLKGEETRYVRMGSLPSVAVLVARGIAETLSKNKDFVLRVMEMQHYQLLPALRRGECDFVIGLGDMTEPESGIRRRFLGHDQLLFTVRVGHRLLRAKNVALANLLDFPWVFPIVGTNHFFPAIRQMFDEAGLPPPEPRIETGSMQFVKSLILSSDAIGILARHVTEAEVRTGQVATLPIDSPLLDRNITAFHRTASPLSRAARDVLNEIERAFHQWERNNMQRARPR
jgi:DNA-binding transcriptional LysR family regulator